MKMGRIQMSAQSPSPDSSGRVAGELGHPSRSGGFCSDRFVCPGEYPIPRPTENHSARKFPATWLAPRSLAILPDQPGPGARNPLLAGRDGSPSDSRIDESILPW
jgi:hypothetical protein